MSNTTQTAGEGPDWRLRFSLALTAGWLILGFVYISSIVGWTHFVSQQAPALGSFLEGAFAPLAFLWLVVGFFLQQQQLRENTATIQLQLEQMRRSAEQAEVQARAIAADELHSRQDTFLRSSGLVRDQLSMIAGWIITSFVESTDEIRALWERNAQGQDSAFPMDAIRRCLSGEVEAAVLFHGTEIRHGHSVRFMKTFERLVESAISCESNGMIEDAIREGAHGRVYRMMKDSDPS